MNEENKKSKKRILSYYLVLGACILIIAAITVGVIFAVNGTNSDPTIDGGNNENVDEGDGSNGGNEPNDGNNGGENNDDSQNTSTRYEFIAPLESVDIINSYTFYRNSTLDYYHFHTGLDFAAEEGADVLACVDGTVESITRSDVLDGTVVTLTHENGVKTVYSFIDVAEGLKVGDKVARGDVIGTIAEPTGKEYKEGAHLHFEVFVNGEVADPELYLDIDAK